MLPRVMPEIAAENGFRLRRWELTDRELLREVSVDPYIPLITTVPAPYSDAEADAFVRRQWMRTEIGTGYPFVIEAPDGRAVGNVGLWVGELPLRGFATAGYWVAAGARGRGVALAGLNAVTAWALGELALPRVELFVEPWNAGSLRTAEKAGYRRETLVPAYQEVAGEPRDMWRFALP
ncbi:GNAT family N-acetyltransferase [Kitasatospora sp. CB01950]|uniref:GNAT family N-acetyltransferase n=1 Tax=Kitasatospora sp. CB01950 TaxID=1703930 RepID=UPI001F52A280|nr:GNAT family N-acetyltransferase [Kitasatospora sp. CB01950]